MGNLALQKSKLVQKAKSFQFPLTGFPANLDSTGNEYMFALVVDDTLFFKADGRTKPDFDALDLPPFTYQKRNRQVFLSYYQAPDETLEDAAAMLPWAEKAYAAALRAARKTRTT
jgi:TfoX/Sxy family transcriptional regulator of competence genes